ncbi:MAG: aminotransferase class V-fold PLP-dependent enzyme [candidate division Zixibacteria bacterium]|nr:aminotransferase class V-fold PLP-dependent enzyme [candidate division Zixibacteria bacterium]
MFDLQSVRTEFPVVDNVTYLNHAAVGTISRRARRAVEEYVKDFNEYAAAHYAAWETRQGQVRALMGRLVDAPPEQMAFVKNTTEGISFAANGLDWREGDNVILNSLEFPSNALPWMNLAYRGVETRWVQALEGRVTIDDIRNMIDRRTRVVALSHVEFGNGYRNDLADVGALCREQGVYFVVDGIQSLGQMPVSVRETPVDALVADAHKWLLGPEGIGLFYCAPDFMDRLRLYEVGWKSVANIGNYDVYDLTPHPTAERFEGGSANVLGIYALGGAIELFLEVGMDTVQKRLRLLTDTLCDALLHKGYRLLSPRGENEWSGIVTFNSDRYANEELHKILRSRNVIGSRRGGGIRISPHFYNTEEEVLRVTDALPDH